jgi:hypothetical protein
MLPEIPPPNSNRIPDGTERGVAYGLSSETKCNTPADLISAG